MAIGIAVLRADRSLADGVEARLTGLIMAGDALFAFFHAISNVYGVDRSNSRGGPRGSVEGAKPCLRVSCYHSPHRL